MGTLTDVPCVTCGSCGAEAWGFTRPELAADGWVVEHARGVPFHICPDCTRNYRVRRALEALYALPVGEGGAHSAIRPRGDAM